jgi:hypothetical protein
MDVFSTELGIRLRFFKTSEFLEGGGLILIAAGAGDTWNGVGALRSFGGAKLKKNK